MPAGTTRPGRSTRDAGDELVSPASGWRGQVVGYGHWGHPVLVFPSEAGRAWDFGDNGMIEPLRWLLDAGRLKLYCVDSADAATWSDQSIPLEEPGPAARRLRALGARPGGPLRARRLRRADADHRHGLQPGRLPRRQHRAAARSRLPSRAVPVRLLRPGGVERLGRPRRRELLPQPDRVRRQSAAATTWTGCAGRCSSSSSSARGPGRSSRPARCRAPWPSPSCWRRRACSHELDVWGYDTPHDWSSWQRQVAHHLPRFC